METRTNAKNVECTFHDTSTSTLCPKEKNCSTCGLAESFLDKHAHNVRKALENTRSPMFGAMVLKNTDTQVGKYIVVSGRDMAGLLKIEDDDFQVQFYQQDEEAHDFILQLEKQPEGHDWTGSKEETSAAKNLTRRTGKLGDFRKFGNGIMPELPDLCIQHAQLLESGHDKEVSCDFDSCGIKTNGYADYKTWLEAAANAMFATDSTEASSRNGLEFYKSNLVASLVCTSEWESAIFEFNLCPPKTTDSFKSFPDLAQKYASALKLWENVCSDNDDVDKIKNIAMQYAKLFPNPELKKLTCSKEKNQQHADRLYRQLMYVRRNTLLQLKPSVRKHFIDRVGGENFTTPEAVLQVLQWEPATLSTISRDVFDKTFDAAFDALSEAFAPQNNFYAARVKSALRAFKMKLLSTTVNMNSLSVPMNWCCEDTAVELLYSLRKMNIAKETTSIEFCAFNIQGRVCPECPLCKLHFRKYVQKILRTWREPV